MKKVLQFIVTPAMLVLVVYMGWKIYTKTDSSATLSAINYIREHMSTQGVLVDYTDDIGVKTVEDIKLFVTPKKITIEFGKILLSWDSKDFETEKNKSLLYMIGITMDHEPGTDRLRVYYRGEELTRWAS